MTARSSSTFAGSCTARGRRHRANAVDSLLGILHHCLNTGTHYNENIAYPATADTRSTTAA